MLRLDKIKDRIHLANVMRVNRKPQSNALANGHAILDSPHRRRIGAFPAAKIIVHIGQPIKANTDVGHAYLFYLFRRVPRDQRPVRRQRRPYAAIPGVGGQLEKVWPDERLAAGKEQRR